MLDSPFLHQPLLQSIPTSVTPYFSSSMSESVTMLVMESPQNSLVGPQPVGLSVSQSLSVPVSPYLQQLICYLVLQSVFSIFSH